MEILRPHVMSVKETTDKYQLKEFTVRQWVKSGALPAVYAGRKIYISEQVLVDFLNGRSNAEN